MSKTAAGSHTAVLVGLGLCVGLALAGTTLAQSSPGGGTPISSCTVLDDSGRYELTRDLAAETGVCLYVRSGDVTIDGNGHTVTGSGAPDSTGVLVFNGTVDQRRRGPELSNVTVRDLRVRGWQTGVGLGVFAHDGPRATLENVTAADNHVGVRLLDADRSTLRNVTASGGSDGVLLWETADVRATDLVVAGNDDTGLYLAQEVTNGTFRRVTAVDNDDEGVSFSTSVARNRLADARVTANGGPGIEFADSYRNVVENTTVVGNGGPGVLSNPASEDTLRNVTIQDNAGSAYLSESSFGGVAAENARLSARTTVDWTSGVERIAVSSSPPAPPVNATVVSDSVRIETYEGRNATADVRLGYDRQAVSETDGRVALWQWTGGNWTRLSNVTVDERTGTVSGSVSGDGIVAVLSSGADTN
ncbi:right-handed parallel beta-helix repeat-containing protein [Haloarcula sp. JP-L23]|uniref:right-handed parallel beta-helix repeat-containing protein n=1 Tax=Haloarcula sp. JP-L23 TaxID=2716717 RepID=UPI00140EA388|nr:right-handed parallel beta-helix repeat-containing protein [Haloarcula sp. JP-L23]